MGESYKHDEQISVNMLSLPFVLVKSKNQNYLAQKMTICIFVLLIYIYIYIYIIDMVLLFILLYQSNFFLHDVHAFLQNLLPIY